MNKLEEYLRNLLEKKTLNGAPVVENKDWQIYLSNEDGGQDDEIVTIEDVVELLERVQG